MKIGYMSNGKRYAHGNGSRQSGFSLPEMLIVVSIVAMLGLLVQPMLRLGHQALLRIAKEHAAPGQGITEALQWLENDILQWRGDKPWLWEGTLDPQSCLVRWEFVTSNIPVTEGTGTAWQTVRYSIKASTLWRETLKEDNIHDSRVLLRHIDCLHPQFWQYPQWVDAPNPERVIKGIKLSLTWRGPAIERRWPVMVSYGKE